MSTTSLKVLIYNSGYWKRWRTRHMVWGLAAPQIGVDLCMFVMERSPKNTEVIINPQITAFKGERLVMEEGCLSIPNHFGYVFRHQTIEVEYFNGKGTYVVEKFRGWPARIFQHEFDHLNGVLFTDKEIK